MIKDMIISKDNMSIKNFFESTKNNKDPSNQITGKINKLALGKDKPEASDTAIWPS